MIALACACAVMPSSAWGVGPGDGFKLAPRVDRPQPEAEGAFVPGEAIVRFEPGAGAATRRAARRRAGVDFEDALGLPRTQVVEVDGSVQSAVGRLEAQPGVAYAQPNYRYEATAPAPEPNDSFFDQLWGLDDPEMPDPGVGALDAWEAGEKGTGQVIAILDTGVDLTHPDLLGNLWEGEAGVHGHDFVDGDSDPDDYNFHGTHVAGTAAATADNTQGIAGVAPAAEIMAVRVLDGDGFGDTAGIVEGINYAVANEADVINMSLGGPSDTGDEAMENAIEAAGEADAVVVVAAGNDGVDNDIEPHTPCALPNPNLICVAAIRQSDGALASFSNFGVESVDIAAPGSGILSAKTDYKAILAEGFDNAELSGWERLTKSGIVWGGTDAIASDGTHSAADSPGLSQKYAPNSNTQLIRSISEPTVLTGQRGCRSHFDLRRDVQPPVDGEATDEFVAGALSELAEIEATMGFTGSSGGVFRRTQVSISALDGQPDAFPAFALFSDGTDQRDGVYVDDLEILCRDSTSYVNDIAPPPPAKYDKPSSGNYVEFAGTSMATPHVAGVVALVRAAEPGLAAGEVINAVLSGASAIPEITSGKRIATEGIADACQAVAIATGANVAAECPASSEPTPQPPESGGTVPPEIPDAPVTAAPNVPSPPPPVDGIDPQTFFRHTPPRVVRTRGRGRWAVFRFGSNEAGVVFRCQFDRKRYRICPRRFVRWFRLGRHVLRVKARDAAGNVDPDPAVHRFRVLRAGRNHGAAIRRNTRHHRAP